MNVMADALATDYYNTDKLALKRPLSLFSLLAHSEWPTNNIPLARGYPIPHEWHMPPTIPTKLENGVVLRWSLEFSRYGDHW